MSRSKNVYQGLNVQRIHRSELDDNKLKDLAREDARLGENLKTVERARNVMLKSMDADKHLFIKAGAQTNYKTQRPNSFGSYQKLTYTQSPLVSARSMPDTSKVKRQISSELPAQETFADSQTEKARHHTPNSSDLAPHHEEPVSLYEQFLQPSKGPLSEKRPSKASLHAIGEGQSAVKNGVSSSRSEETDSTNALAESGSNSNAHGCDDKIADNEAGVTRELSAEIRRPNVWEALSTPKHISLTKAKRAQVEREFLRPNKVSSKVGNTPNSKTDLTKRKVVVNKNTGQALTRRS